LLRAEDEGESPPDQPRLGENKCKERTSGGARKRPEKKRLLLERTLDKGGTKKAVEKKRGVSEEDEEEERSIRMRKWGGQGLGKKRNHWGGTAVKRDGTQEQVLTKKRNNSATNS